MIYNHENTFLQNEKYIKLAKNGDSTISTKLNFKGKLSFSIIIEHAEKKFCFSNTNRIRLFNAEGVELFDQDIDFIKDKETIYVSQGEDFDYSSYYSEYEIIKTLGQGGFGKVVLGQHKQTKEKVAIKIVNTGGIGTVDDLDLIYTEAGVLKSLAHENIVKIKNYFLLKNSQAIFIMEFCEGGELLKYVEEKGHLEEEEVRCIFSQMVSAIRYCHKHKIIHRDLKLENVLFFNLKDKIIKVVDFGIAGLCAGANTEKTIYGSRYYSAPELLTKKNLNASFGLDIWAMGIMLYCMLIGTYPFIEKGKNNKDKIDSLRNQIISEEVKFPKTGVQVSYEAKNLIQHMLEKDPDDRISLGGIQSHPWMKRTTMPVDEEKKQEESFPSKEKEVKKIRSLYSPKPALDKNFKNLYNARTSIKSNETTPKNTALASNVKRQSTVGANYLKNHVSDSEKNKKTGEKVVPTQKQIIFNVQQIEEKLH